MDTIELKTASDIHTHEYLTHEESNTIAAIAPHGGYIEEYTDQQAFHLANSLNRCSAWAFCGYGSNENNDGAYEQHHVESKNIEESELNLAEDLLMNKFAHIVSFHGFEPEQAVDVYLGGQLERSAQEKIASRIQSKTGLAVRVAEVGDGLYHKYGGHNDSNITNRWCTEGGLQLEQTIYARENQGTEICEAVADVLGE